MTPLLTGSGWSIPVVPEHCGCLYGMVWSGAGVSITRLNFHLGRLVDAELEHGDCPILCDGGMSLIEIIQSNRAAWGTVPPLLEC